MDDVTREIEIDGSGNVALVEASSSRRRVLVGPVSIDATVERARRLLEGRSDHHSVTGLINDLALALVAGAGRGRWWRA